MKRTNAGVNQITEGVIWKQLLYFFFPILLGTFFQQLYNTADAIVVGQFVGKEALAAVGGSTGTIINLFVGFFVGLSSGATVIISQHYGAGRAGEVSRAVHTAMALAILGGAGITLVGVVGAPWALRAIGTPDEIMGYALTYMRVYFLGMIPSLIYNMGTGILRAIGDSKRPLYFLIASCLTNIALDLLFVVGFHWEVFGAAFATVLSQILSACLVAVCLLRSDTPCRVMPKEIRIHAALLGRILRIGFPAGIQSVVYSVSNIIIQSSINSFGTDTMAAWTAYGKIDSLFWMISGAFGISITTFVGQNYGAERYDRMKKSVRVCLGMTFAASAAISLLLLLSGHFVYRLFTDDLAVIELGMQILTFLVPTYCTFVCVEILSGAIRGTGKSLVPMLLTCFGVCGLRMIWILGVVPFYHTLKMVLFSYPMTWSVTSVLFIIYYLHCKKRWNAPQDMPAQPMS